MKAMTLRLPEEVHESLRREAFDRRVPMSEIILDAIEHRRINGSLGCDVCGNPKVVHVSTPGGFRFCADHWNPAGHDRDHMGICRRCGQGLTAADIVHGEGPCLADADEGKADE